MLSSDPIFLHAAHLGAEILKIERGLLQLLRHGLGFVGLEGALRLLDQGEHVAHAEDAARHALGVEYLEIGKFFTDADVLHRSAGYGLDGQGRAASGVAVHLGQYHAGEFEIAARGFGHRHRVLTGHGVGHEQDFLRLHGGLDVHQLLHERRVDVQTARGIENDHGALLFLRVLDGGLDIIGSASAEEAKQGMSSWRASVRS